MAPYLDEKLLRLSVGALAVAFGAGSASAVAVAAGVSGSTVGAGIRDLAQGTAPVGRVRRPGGGRKGVEVVLPGVWAALDALVEPEERGDPDSPLRWTVKSTRNLADELALGGFRLSHGVVGALLRGHGYSLRGAAKVLEGTAVHGADRDRQFRYINETTRAFLAAGQPVISVDTKKKEQVGNFDRPGRTWRPYKDPVKVQDHSFPSQATATAVPYGVYDVGSDDGFVNLGVSHDTPAFAVASIRRWWTMMGQDHYPRARRLLVVADSGGSNSIRSLVFKVLLHQMAVETGLEITMCHLPPGTSKWNKVEHRLFAQISSTWRGRPLTSLQVVVESIAATRTRTGLSVTCVLDERDYPTGLTSDWDHIDALPLTFHDVGGRWNYTIAPHPADPARTTTRPPRPGQPARPPTHTAPLGTPAERATWIKGLTTPETTAIPTATWNELAAHLEPAYRHLRDQAARERRGGREKTNPNHPGPTLTVPLTTLMLATVLHVRHHTPVEQISRLIDLKSNGLKIHITRLTALFTDHGHPITPTDTKTWKLETLLTTAHLPQPAPTTHQNTS